MAGQQHPYPTGFPNTQQTTMRNQFGGGQMVSGLMSPQQGIVNQQQFGPGVNAGVNPNAMNMLNTQQMLAQQQQQQQQNVVLQQQMQHLQQQQQQQQMQLQQQQQQQVLAQQNSQVGNQAIPSQAPVARQQPPPPPTQQQKQQNKELTTASLCKYGQETVQEIVTRMQEVFNLMKLMQLPNGTGAGSNLANEKKVKLQEHLRMLEFLFKRLRLVYEKCNENCQLQGLEYTHIESLIPLKDEVEAKPDEKKTSESYRLMCEECKEITEQVKLKNTHLKEIIDHLRRIISEINTMLYMRRS